MFGLDAVPFDAETEPLPPAPEPARPESTPPPRKAPEDRITRAVPEVQVVTASTRSPAGEPLEPAISLATDLGDDPATVLAGIRDHHATHCPLCRSAGTARSIVFGEGNPDADLVFVGEAPGEQEDRDGRPFVGPAGALLDKMIAALGLSRDEVYVTNVVKTRPLENRTPRPDEAAVCGRWLANELLSVRPKAIVALGGTPAKHLLATTSGITRLRGIWGSCRIHDVDLPVMPTFHPAFVLRQYTTEVRSAVWQDLQEAKARAVPG
jgi:DNA polymerase